MRISNSEFEREFDIRELFQVLIRKMWIILSIGLCSGLIIFLISYFFIDWKYESTTQIYVLNKQDNTEQVTYSDMETSNYLIEDYKTLATSRLVTGQVIAELKLDMKHEELVKLIHIENPVDTRVLFITVEYKDPEIAKQLADTIRDATNTLISSLTNDNKVSEIVEANVPEEPSSPDIKRNMLLAGVLGVLISTFIILLRYLSDNTIKNTYDIENILDIKVLSIIRLRKDKTFRKKFMRRNTVDNKEVNKKSEQEINKAAETFAVRNMINSTLKTNESYLKLRSSFQMFRNSIKTIGLTSCSKDNQKSVTALYLAASLADTGKKVLLVATDNSSTILSNKPLFFELQELNGSNLLSDNTEEEKIYRTDINNLDLTLDIGYQNNTKSPDKERYIKFFKKSEETYDYILFDIPAPDAPSYEADMIKACDGMILVIKANEVDYKTGRDTKAMLEISDCPVLGAVLLLEA